MRYLKVVSLGLFLCLSACSPTINLEVNIDSTAVALLATMQAEQAQSSIVVVETPTPEAPQASELPWVQSTLETGDILYEFDEDGFSIALPEDWQVINLDDEEFSNALSMIGDQNASLKEIFTSDYFRSLAAAGMRFYALNTSLDSLQSDTPMNINIIKQTLPLEFTLEEYVAFNVSQLEQIFDLQSDIVQETRMLGDTESVRITYTTNLVGPFGNLLELQNAQYLIVVDDVAYIVTMGMVTDLVNTYFTPSLEAVETFRLN